MKRGPYKIKSDDAITMRLLARVKQVGECWLWTGCKRDDGYGKFKLRGVYWLAHRWFYKFYIGALPVYESGLVIDHVCNNKLCVRPDHLQILTIAENRWKQV